MNDFKKSKLWTHLRNKVFEKVSMSETTYCKNSPYITFIVFFILPNHYNSLNFPLECLIIYTFLSQESQYLNSFDQCKLLSVHYIPNFWGFKIDSLKKKQIQILS